MKNINNFCKECIVAPLCSRVCYTNLTIIETGDGALLKIALDGGWKGIEDLEKDLGIYPEDTEEVYWILRNYDLRYKFIDLKKFRWRDVEIGNIVHGRFYTDKMEAYVLPSKELAVSWL